MTRDESLRFDRRSLRSILHRVTGPIREGNLLRRIFREGRIDQNTLAFDEIDERLSIQDESVLVDSWVFLIDLSKREVTIPWGTATEA